MKIIHITEALASGVAYCLSQLAQAQVADGHQVMIVHSVRPETPAESISDLFPAPIECVVLPMETPIAPVADLRALWQIRALLKAEKPDVVHLHSSKAGVLGRLAVASLGIQNRSFYSPHGFAFLKEDSSPIKRKLYLGLERFAGKLGGTLIGCSATEASLAQTEVRHPKTVLVENAIDLGAVPSPVTHGHGRVRVVASGRLCHQKAPWRFRDLAQYCMDLPADFVWLGDGELRDDLLVDGKLPENLEVSGWQSRSTVYLALAEADMFVMPSLWEGMPLAVIEAQAMGLPAVVSDVVGNRDVVIDGKSGFVCKTDAELQQKTRMLIENAALRKQMGVDAQGLAFKRFGMARMHQELISVYLA